MSTVKNDTVATSTITQLTRRAPLYIRMHANDNVAIVVNDGGLPAGTEFPDEFVLRDRVPQGHKIALCDLAEGDPGGRQREHRDEDQQRHQDLPQGERLAAVPAAHAEAEEADHEDRVLEVGEDANLGAHPADEQEFEELFRKYRQLVYRAAYTVTGSGRLKKSGQPF